jgi:hypothetical protein
VVSLGGQHLLGWDDVSKQVRSFAEGEDISPDVRKLANTLVLLASRRLVGPSEVSVNPYRRYLSIHWNETIPALELEIEGEGGFTIYQFPQGEASGLRWLALDPEGSVPPDLFLWLEAAKATSPL